RTAVATARSQSGAVRRPSDQRRLVGGDSGSGSGPGTSGSTPIVVSHDRPSLRASTTLGMTRTEPSDVGSNVKLPNATGPDPGTRTSSLTRALSNCSRSHFSPAVNLSWPAGRVIVAAVPQPTRPSPRLTQASACGCGSRLIRSPGSGTATVLTTSLSGTRLVVSS